MHRRQQPKEQFHASDTMDPRDLDLGVMWACSNEVLPPPQDPRGVHYCLGLQGLPQLSLCYPLMSQIQTKDTTLLIHYRNMHWHCIRCC